MYQKLKMYQELRMYQEQRMHQRLREKKESVYLESRSNFVGSVECWW